jgi:serine/threonine protein kinase
MRLFDHPNILKLLDVIESPQTISLIEQYAPRGSLFDRIHALPVQKSFEYFRQLIDGLEYLHSLSICHRDIKPENLLFDVSGQLLIADFGLACWMPHGVAFGSCGSPHYTAPEVISRKSYDGCLADIWSCGVILYAMLTGRLPFDDDSMAVTLGNIQKGSYKMPDLDPDVQDLLARLLTVDPAWRITIPEIRGHPAVTAGLPDDYRLPSPLPLPHIARPIVVGVNDEVFIEIVEHIGFTSRSDVIEQLAAEGSNMAKVFFNMLSQPFDCGSIPWPADHPFIHPVDPDFVCDGLPVLSEQEDSIRNLRIGLVELMAAIQRHLDAAEFVWYHPNYRTVIGKSRLQDVCCILTAVYERNETITLIVNMQKATAMEFLRFFDALGNFLSRERQIVPSDQLTEMNSIRGLKEALAAYVDDGQHSGCNPM